MEVGAALEQQLDDIQMAEPSRTVQCSLTAILRRVEVGAALEQQLDDI